VYFGGDIAAYIAFNSLLPIAEIAFIENYLSQKYCRPDAITRQAMTLALRPSLPNAARLDTAAAPTACDRVWDAGGKAHDAYQTTDACEELVAPSANFGGQKSLTSSAATGQGYNVSVGVGWSADKGHSVLVPIFNPKVTTAAATTMLIDPAFVQSLNPLFATALPTSIERMGGYDGAYRIAARAFLGVGLLEWHITAANTLTMYANGVLVGSSAMTAAAWAGVLTLGNSPAFGNQTIQEFAEVLNKEAAAGQPLAGTALWEAREKIVVDDGFAWNAALVPDHVSILDPRVSDSVTTAGGAVSRVNSQHANIDVIADGSCEAAGVTAWAAVNSAVLTKSAVTPFAGLLSLQIAYDGVHANPYARQTVMVIGQTYRLQCHMWGDGGAGIPKIKDSAVTLFTGVNAAAWQAVDVTFVATGTTIDFGADIAVAGFVKVDTISLVNVTAGAETQAVALNQPVHTAGAGGYITYDGVQTFTNGMVPPSAAGTIIEWEYLVALPGAEDAFYGSYDGTRRTRVTVNAAGLVTGYTGTVAALSGPTAGIGAWFPIIQRWNSITQQVGVGANIRSQANATTASTRAMVIGANDENGVIGTFLGHRRGPRHVISRAADVREIMRIVQQEGASYGFALPAPMTPADWNAQLCGCSDQSVTTPGGPVSAWADRLNRAGMGATSPGAAATFPQHSVVDNSLNFVGTALQYMRWIVVPNVNAGTFEMWFYVPAFPAGSVEMAGAYDNVGVHICDCYMSPTGAVSFRNGLAGGNQAFSINTVNVGSWNHVVGIWTVGALSSITLNGITALATVNAISAPNATAFYLGALNILGVPSGYSTIRIAKASLKASAISISQAVANFCADYDAIVYHEGT
jgi:hypothetical protein